MNIDKNVVIGTPVNPAHLIDSLAGYSFCVSFATKDKLGNQLEQIIDLVNGDESGESFILIDNGAFSHWTRGGEMTDDYVEAFEAWAKDIIARCPRSIAVIPDVIGGSLEDNWNLINWSTLDTQRAMPIWHLDEPISSLLHMVEGGFGYIGFGSSGQYGAGKGAEWEARVQEALDAIDKLVRESQGAYFMPRIHMMRCQAQHHKFPFASSDSTNVAVNHGRYKDEHGDDRVRMLADRVKGKITASGKVEVRYDYFEEAALADDMTAAIIKIRYEPYWSYELHVNKVRAAGADMVEVEGIIRNYVRNYNHGGGLTPELKAEIEAEKNGLPTILRMKESEYRRGEYVRIAG